MAYTIAIIVLASLCAFFCFACLWVGVDYDRAIERQTKMLYGEDKPAVKEKDVSVENCPPK